MEKITFTREKLYDLVWSESLLTISKKYSISDVGLRKICVRLNIPLPRAGHWAQAPEDRPKPGKLPVFTGREQEVDLKIRTTSSDPQNPSISDLRMEVERDPAITLTVPDRLTSPDKLISAVKADLQSKIDERRSHKDVVSSSDGMLDIRVTKENLPRALRFLDTLIKALRGRGHDIKVENDKTYASVNGQKVKMTYRERLKQVVVSEGSWNRTEWHASGIVYFRTEGVSNREWKDGKLTIEGQLSAIVAKIELDSQELAAREAQWKQWREDYEKKEQIRTELAQRKEQELAGFIALSNNATRWRQANLIREYLEAMEQAALARGGLSTEGKAWLSWARAKANWYDPLIEEEDEWLQGVDRNAILLPQNAKNPF